MNINNFGRISFVCAILSLLLLASLSGVYMNILLFLATFLILTITGLICAIRSKQTIVIIIAGSLNGLLLIYAFLILLGSLR